ncbi:MAG: RnfABCDGE type electron transport complex subunit D [Deferrisomatales bacterium]
MATSEKKTPKAAGTQRKPKAPARGKTGAPEKRKAAAKAKAKGKDTKDTKDTAAEPAAPPSAALEPVASPKTPAKPSTPAPARPARPGPKPAPALVRWQPNMVDVLTALAPAGLAAVYLYGWRALAVLAVTNAFAFATELYFTRQRGEPVTSAVFVTGSLLALSLPPRTPFWMCALGAAVGVAFGKELFGGMGRNVFNPALVGRAFLYVGFPTFLTAGWVEPLAAGAGGLARWSADAVTSATPLPLLARGEAVSALHLLLGAVPGSLGEGCKALLLLGGAYLLWKKVASWEIMGSTIGAYVLFTALFRLFGWGAGPDPLHGVLAGGFLYGAVFMATDPVSANRTTAGRFAYGALIGLATALIRDFGNFPEGIMFAILLGNTLGPITEEALEAWKRRRAPEAPS